MDNEVDPVTELCEMCGLRSRVDNQWCQLCLETVDKLFIAAFNAADSLLDMKEEIAAARLRHPATQVVEKRGNHIWINRQGVEVK